MKDLTTEEGRIAAFSENRKNFLDALRNAGVELSKTTDCNLVNGYVSIFINREDGKYLFASGVEFYVREDGVKMDYSSSGSFTPLDEGPYQRTILAASILKNWDAVCTIVNEYCDKYRQLGQEIDKLNQTK